MDFLWDAITEWLKEILVSGIMSNLSGMFDGVNDKVGEISTQVGMTPQALSYHLKKLREAELIYETRRKNFIFYELDLTVLDEAIFLKDGQVVLHNTVDAIREQEGKSVDALFREVFRARNYEGGIF